MKIFLENILLSSDRSAPPRLYNPNMFTHAHCALNLFQLPNSIQNLTNIYIQFYVVFV